MHGLARISSRDWRGAADLQRMARIYGCFALWSRHLAALQAAGHLPRPTPRPMARKPTECQRINRILVDEGECLPRDPVWLDQMARFPDRLRRRICQFHGMGLAQCAGPEDGFPPIIVSSRRVRGDRLGP